jgi:S1-C subfamily serine protease
MALFPAAFLDAVVSIGTVEKDEFESLATGFLVGFYNGAKDKEKRDLLSPFLVTNRHVFDELERVTLRFNLTTNGSKTYNLALKDGKKELWTAHPNKAVDIAAIGINTDLLSRDGIRYSVLSETHIAYLETIRREGITQGDGVFTLGFPMGIAGKEKNYVIIRGGVISRLDDEIIDDEHHFLIDAHTFPGNSGGPVILKPEVVSIEGTNAVSKTYLLGVVSKYVTYEEKAYSEQTDDLRAIFVENSGITEVVPMDYVKQTIEPILKFIKERRL